MAGRPTGVQPTQAPTKRAGRGAVTRRRPCPCRFLTAGTVTAAGQTISSSKAPNPACSVPAHSLNFNPAPFRLVKRLRLRLPACPACAVVRPGQWAGTASNLSRRFREGTGTPGVSDRLSLIPINFPNPQSLSLFTIHSVASLIHSDSPYRWRCGGLVARP